MYLNLPGRTQSVAARRVVETERAVAEFERRLASWDRQRAAVVSGDLGSDPFALVDTSWPSLTAIGAASAASEAAPLSPAAIEAEAGSLRWAGLGKLTVGGLSILILLSIPVSLVLTVLS